MTGTEKDWFRDWFGTEYLELYPHRDEAEAARAVAAAGADGLSLVNTIRGLALDRTTLEPVLARAVGGYSGPALKPIALACVYACASAVDLPIVGMGGIQTGTDVLEFVAAGASAVALGTVLFADPDGPKRIRTELAAAVEDRRLPGPLSAHRAALEGVQNPPQPVEKPL